MANGKQPLPWWAATAAISSGQGTAREIAAQFSSTFTLWAAALDELEIVRRELHDTLRCCVEHLEIVGRRGDALGLPCSTQTFTSLESHVAYLKCFVRDTVSLHARAAKKAEAYGAKVALIPQEVIQKLIHQRLCDNGMTDANYVSVSQQSEQTFDELFRPEEVVDEEDTEEGISEEDGPHS